MILHNASWFFIKKHKFFIVFSSILLQKYRFRLRFLQKISKTIGFLKVIFQNTGVFLSGEPRGTRRKNIPWKMIFKNSMLFDTFCKNLKRNRYFWSKMLENSMKNQCFFMKFQEASCRITTFEEKTLTCYGKSMFFDEIREKPLKINENRWSGLVVPGPGWSWLLWLVLAALAAPGCSWLLRLLMKINENRWKTDGSQWH